MLDVVEGGAPSVEVPVTLLAAVKTVGAYTIRFTFNPESCQVFDAAGKHINPLPRVLAMEAWVFATEVNLWKRQPKG